MADTESVKVGMATNVLSHAIDFRRYTSGRFHLPAAFNGKAIAFQDSDHPGGTFAISKQVGASIDVGFTANSAPAWYDIPAVLTGAGAIKISTGAIAGHEATEITVCLKSD